ncbi:hypothetical protein [Acinetobacter sp. ANC 3832]|uniref:hypothetical protein n=1 Tax=Acinetobacter sp. ANC 3832 TaxID=1977874 RepID=UPI000A354040|nr:hypothetical protein [Acinetobacter sp. ANC 3832]OTG94707.1 hypothetical protein B9T35_04835 [Acinetobacter sp. ANC 3832]
MLKHSLLIASLLLSLSSCSTFKTTHNFKKPLNLMFINNDINTIPLQIKRNEKLCDDDKENNQNCPIKLYIDDFKAGDFYINNATTYYLKPNEYVLTVKNCKEKCNTFHMKIIIDSKLPTTSLILSINQEGKPFIINKNL